MKALIDTIMEKHAVSLRSIGRGIQDTWAKVPWVKSYRATAASPSFKVKQKLALGTAAVAPVAAGAYWLDKPEQAPHAHPAMLGQNQGTM